jgi:hypothetical protein
MIDGLNRDKHMTRYKIGIRNSSNVAERRVLISITYQSTHKFIQS